MSQSNAIRPRVRDAILQSLRAGVTPRVGQSHIQVGRAQEINAVVGDVERICDGGSGIRFVIGEYGSGKTFFLNLIRAIAIEKKLVVAHADLDPSRRLHASKGQARSLYQELIRNVSTRSRPEGGAFESVVERFVTTARTDAGKQNQDVEAIIQERLARLSEMVGGYDFAEVVAAYWRAHEHADPALKANAVRWLRGEYLTRTDARKALGVRAIIDDTNVYDHLKLVAVFTRLAGYRGLLVCLDELVNLYKIPNRQARTANYEQILRILNDSLQGASNGLGFMLGGTPEFLMDTRKGLYSYEALQSRLAQNHFLRDGLVDMSGPVLHLENLAQEDFFVLLAKIRNIYAAGKPDKYLIPDAGITAFMDHCAQRIGEAYFRTPRATITAFVNLLAVLEQNPGSSWQNLLGQVEVATESNPDLAPLKGADLEQDDDELSSFKL